MTTTSGFSVLTISSKSVWEWASIPYFRRAKEAWRLVFSVVPNTEVTLAPCLWKYFPMYSPIPFLVLPAPMIDIFIETTSPLVSCSQKIELHFNTVFHTLVMSPVLANNRSVVFLENYSLIAYDGSHEKKGFSFESSFRHSPHLLLPK